MTASPSRRPHSPAAAPLDDEDLLTEILLRLSPLPSSLPRASLVCKRWRRIVSNPRFVRRFHLHHRRNPPLLGYFHQNKNDLSFVPTLEAPNRIPPGRFSLQLEGFLPLGCRHGLLLLCDQQRRQILVWDPVTGDQHRIDVPPGIDMNHTTIHGAVLRAAGEARHFRVVLVVACNDDGQHGRMVACVYSSEAGVWGKPISTPIPSGAYMHIYPINVLFGMPALLVGDSLYCPLTRDVVTILEFDLGRNSLAVIQLPVGICEEDSTFTVMRAQGGGLGLLVVSAFDFSAKLWKRKTDCDSWLLGRTIEPDKLLSLNPMKERELLQMVGFAEYNDVALMWTVTRLFMVQPESLQLKELSATKRFSCRHPFEGVYAAETCIDGGLDGAEVWHNS